MFQDESVKTILTRSHKAPQAIEIQYLSRCLPKQASLKRLLYFYHSIWPHNDAQIIDFPIFKQPPLTNDTPKVVWSTSPCSAEEFISTASVSTVSGLLTLFSKCFSSFLHSTCSLSVSYIYLALEEVYLPLSALVSKYTTLRLPAR